MRKKNHNRVPLLVFAAIAGLSFALWVGGLALAWRIGRALGAPTDLWAMVSALSTAAGTALVLGAGYLAYRELGESTSSRHMEVADRLFAELNAPASIEARRWVYQELPDDPAQGLAALRSEDQVKVKAVLNSLDRVAFLTQPDWMPEETIMPWMSPMVVKAWARLEPWVLYERTRRHEPDFYSSAEDVARRCRRWRMARALGNDFNRVDHAL